MLGCCSSFKKCSDAGRCIYENNPDFKLDLDWKHCLYKENLDKGLNFYTEHNENNRKRAEEYRLKLEKEKIENIKPDDKKKDEVKAAVSRHKHVKTYIEIPNRLFLIGKRSSYNGYTYDLDEDEIKTVMDALNENYINCINNPDESKFKDEELTGKGYCNCRVVLELSGQDYNISNYNSRGLKRETAEKIASYLYKRGLKADIEMFQGFSGSKMIKNLGITEADKNKQKRNTIMRKRPEPVNNYKQLSLFDSSIDLYRMHNAV